jgi:hypothetical protein
VIEGEPDSPELSRRKPSSLRRVVASLDAASDPVCLVKNGDVVTAWIAVRFGVDAEKLSDADPEPGLLEGLPRAAGLGRLLPLAESAGKSPGTPIRRPAPLNQEQAAAPVDDERIDGQTRVP